jgi:hypothetical protein
MVAGFLYMNAIGPKWECILVITLFVLRYQFIS